MKKPCYKMDLYVGFKYKKKVKASILLLFDYKSKLRV